MRQDCGSHAGWNPVGGHFMHWMFPRLPAEALIQPRYHSPWAWNLCFLLVLRLLGSFPTQRLWLLSSLVPLFVRASLIAHLVKNLPAMQETLVQFLGREDPLEKG